jgi:hypothetical protein
MKITLTILAVLIAGPTFAQSSPTTVEHMPPLPTLQQCKADSNAWSMDTSIESKFQLSSEDLGRMLFAMIRCADEVDATNKSKYLAVGDNLKLCVYVRYYKFVHRHPDMLKKFEEEDAAGAR